MNLRRLLLLALLALPLLASQSYAQDLSQRRYDIGNPSLRDLWVDPVNGNNSRDGSSRQQAIRTVTEAWARIPQGAPLTQGYRILLTAGSYPRAELPNYWERRYGTQSAPILIQAADGRGTATFLGDINAFDVRYLYLVDFNLAPLPAGDAFHCEQCDHILLRGMDVSGGNRQAHETIKVNQSRYLYIEDSNIHGSYENNIDFVAVQYGHIIGNRIHDADDWCAYVKGGSAQILVEANEIYNCGTGGFVAGQGTGFEYMSAPWIHYEAYDIKFVNNVVHHTAGAGFGVNGAYNTLLAFNTLYHVGLNSHAIEVVPGLRSCDGETARCAANLLSGGWGTAATGTEEAIPNRNVYIYNNILYNPPGVQSQYAHFSIQGPRTPNPGTNLPNPVVTDNNLRIRGNILWNGPTNLSLGIEDPGQGCQPSNPTCNETQLRADNAINTVEPQLINAAAGDFRPVVGGNTFSATTFAIPTFPDTREPTPLAPLGVLSNVISRDFLNITRANTTPPGAYAGPIRPRAAANGYLLWNSFLGMNNIAELINRGQTTIPVTLTLYDISGNSISQVRTSVPSLGQRDIILNSLPGFVANSYGLVTLDYSSADLDARLTFYRPNGAAFDFAYSTPLISALTGSSSVSFNTFQPSLLASEQTQVVANWLSITNADPVATRSFTVRRYDHDGILLTSRRISVAPFARFDLEAGHENPGPSRVGLNEIIPDESTAPYFATLVRYGTAADRYAFAYPLLASSGATTPIFVPISTGGGAQNWVEVVNSSASSITVSARFFAQNGQPLRDELSIPIAPHSQRHVNASALLGPNASGLVRFASSTPHSLLAHSLFYFYAADGSIESMYGTRALPIAGTDLAGSYNLFLEMYNWLKVSNPTSVPATARILVHTASGIREEQHLLAPYSTLELPLHDSARFGTVADSYGLVEVKGANLIAQLLRIRPLGIGFDFVFPTEVH